MSEGWGGGGAHYRGSKSGGGEGEGLMMQSVKGGRGSSGYSERGRVREGLIVQRVKGPGEGRGSWYRDREGLTVQ